VAKIIAENNVASLQITALGAFTVDVLRHEGLTQLELDLTDLFVVPNEFKNAGTGPFDRRLRMADLASQLD
jgi:hypothetical protein